MKTIDLKRFLFFVMLSLSVLSCSKDDNGKEDSENRDPDPIEKNGKLEWIKRSNIGTSAISNCIVFPVGDYIYYLGDAQTMGDFWRYNYKKDEWKQMKSPRATTVSSGFVRDGRIFILGSPHSEADKSLEYVPASDEWKLASEPSYIQGKIHSPIYVLKDKLYVFFNDCFFSFDKISNTWIRTTTTASHPYVFYEDGVYLNDMIYFTGRSYPSLYIHEFNPENERWTEKENVSTSYDDGMISFAYKGNLYIYTSDQTIHGKHARLYEYDSVKNEIESFEIEGDIQLVDDATRAVVVGDRIFVGPQGNNYWELVIK
jgi:N-acetylneuraminic acid mutarotase